MLKHKNVENCDKCLSILDRYPGLSVDLRNWFLDFRKLANEAHVSCAGRGKADQTNAFNNHLSRSRWGESAHNYNAAIDIFEQTNDFKNIFEIKWFEETLKPLLPPWLQWFGAPDSPFYELPHIQIRDWKSLVKQGTLRLVE